MGLLLIILALGLFTIAAVNLISRFRPATSKAWLPLLASLPVPGLFILYWLFNLWWLQSDHCLDPASCGIGAIGAMTRGAAVGLFGSFFICMTVAMLWINWREKK